MEFYAELTGDSAGIERVDGQAGASFHGCNGWRMLAHDSPGILQYPLKIAHLDIIFNDLAVEYE